MALWTSFDVDDVAGSIKGVPTSDATMRGGVVVQDDGDAWGMCRLRDGGWVVSPPSPAGCKAGIPIKNLTVVNLSDFLSNSWAVSAWGRGVRNKRDSLNAS